MKANPCTIRRHMLHALAAVAILTLATPVSAQTLFVSNPGIGEIDKITSAGTVTAFVSGLNNPFGLAFDGSGKLNVTITYFPYTISKVTPDGMATTFATGLGEVKGSEIDVTLGS